ncbi:MAG: aspartate--tRNA ligase [Candidatus Omnitrophota bacterium]
MLRTHTCGQLTADQIGSKVTLCGWVASRRDHGKIIFIDLRDRYGLTQVVFAPGLNKEVYAQAKELGAEFVILVQGKVNRRPKGTENPRIPTGEVEVPADELSILNTCANLPFEIKEDAIAGSEVRLKYRYLDLRRKKALDNLLLRHNIYSAMRAFLNEQGFAEIETPMLTKSTPEGARDFLVPSRLSPGHFYALPQSPQLFKQILMIAGADRYYQIARCFRDEDLRADRQPEFTQLDLEMSFIHQEDIFNLIEHLLQYVFQRILNLRIVTPFPRLKYEEAMERYQTDKPDLRQAPLGQAGRGEKLAFVWVIDFPLFKYDEAENRWLSEHHPFTAPANEDIELNGSYKDVKALAYDLVLNGSEIGSGSLRIHKPELQEKIFKIIGLDQEEAESRFGFLLQALKYGAPPHGGFALGLDRFTSILANEDTIREVIAFPKTQSGWCPFTDAPSIVNKAQLEELGLEIKKEAKDV